MMEAEGFSDKSPYLYQVMQGHIPEHSNVNFYVRFIIYFNTNT